MTLKLMYITNDVNIAKIAEDCDVDRVFVDLEQIGKSDRQQGMDSVQSKHTIEDAKRIREVLKKSELLVRCNPLHDDVPGYLSSKDEIDEIVKLGADLIMLPYFKTKIEAEQFIKYVDGRTKTMLLIETPEAVENIDDILNLDGIDEVFVGLNDLSLGYNKKFMFELLADGTIDKLCGKFKDAHIPYGFGGIASLGKGLVPAENIIAEHYRLKSNCAILSRSFCNLKEMESLEDIDQIFKSEVKKIREYEMFCSKSDERFYMINQKDTTNIINKVIEDME